MEILRTALYFWNDWVVEAIGLCIGIAFWIRTRRPSALVVAIGTIFIFLNTILDAISGGAPARDPMFFFYGGASAAVGLLGAILLAIGVVWYIAHDRKSIRSRRKIVPDSKRPPK